MGNYLLSNYMNICGFTASFGVFFGEMKCNGQTSFMEFMFAAKSSGYVLPVNKNLR